MKIQCIIIKKNKELTFLSVDPSKSNFQFNHGLYTVPREAVNFAKHGDKPINPTPELVYVEGNPLPVNVSEGKITDFLDHTVIQNALKQLAAPASRFLSVLEDYIRSPAKIILVIFALIILIAFLSGVIKI